eukprot:gene2199-biopygen4302
MRGGSVRWAAVLLLSAAPPLPYKCSANTPSAEPPPPPEPSSHGGNTTTAGASTGHEKEGTSSGGEAHLLRFSARDHMHHDGPRSTFSSISVQ